MQKLSEFFVFEGSHNCEECCEQNEVKHITETRRYDRNGKRHGIETKRQHEIECHPPNRVGNWKVLLPVDVRQRRDDKKAY